MPKANQTKFYNAKLELRFADHDRWFAQTSQIVALVEQDVEYSPVFGLQSANFG